MMTAKNRSAFGSSYKGQDFSKVVDMTVPDQSLSLQEILERFVRNEPLPIGKGGEYDDDADLDNPLSIDLEKIARADMTEVMEYYNALEDLKKRYDAQEKKAAQEKAEADKLEYERHLKEEYRLELEKENVLPKQP